MVTLKGVLTNIKNFSGWNYTNYPLRKEEADVIIDALETTIPFERIEQFRRDFLEIDGKDSWYKNCEGVMFVRGDKIFELIGNMLEECGYNDYMNKIRREFDNRHNKVKDGE